MKDVIKNILREETGDKYRVCSRFTDSDENELCNSLHGLRGWLHSDSGLGLKNVINSKLATIKTVSNILEKYQEPLKILYDTGKHPEIEMVGDKYTHKSFTDKGLVYGENGEWHHVNKLNTNYSDLAELLTELFKRGGIVNKLSTKNEIGLRKYLLTIKDKLSRVLDKYFDIDDYKDFVNNTRGNSEVGEKAEEIVKSILEKFGMRTLYQGGNGDFVDMIFGTDLIMVYKDKVYTIQVKSTETQLDRAREDYRYRSIDYFASPTNIGIVVYNKGGKNFTIDTNGQIVR